MIEAHKFDPETGEWLGKRRIARRQKSRHEPDELLIVGPYTLEEPPAKTDPRRTAVWDKAERKWSEVPDYRRVRVWSKATKERVELALGESLGADHVLTDPRQESDLTSEKAAEGTRGTP